jgi:hypothetical protein
MPSSRLQFLQPPRISRYLPVLPVISFRLPSIPGTGGLQDGTK